MPSPSAQAEKELKAAKEHAEAALRELQETQQSLIEAEKLAALGGLVAGVAHEVNNPVGISLTVASSFARRCDRFSEEVSDGAVRRSKLDEFIAGSQEAAKQLVANLNRAADLIQSFKQVAVDRSHAERRLFDLAESTEQIVVSLRPSLKRSAISLTVDVPAGIQMDSYPGPYGQVLTNLVLNSLAHAFPDKQRRHHADRRHGASEPTRSRSQFADDGIGMSEDVQRRAFEPFFTTRRNRGGTGLGLHIVYNLVTRPLGGRLRLESEPGRGTIFIIRLPLVAPKAEPADGSRAASFAESHMTDDSDLIRVIDDSGRNGRGAVAWPGKSRSSTTIRPCTKARGLRSTTTISTARASRSSPPIRPRRDAS